MQKYYTYNNKNGGRKLGFSLFVTALGLVGGRRKKTKSQLSQPFEYRLIKYSCLRLAAFLVTFLSMSVMASVEGTGATGEVLMALQATDSTVALTSTAETVDLSMAASTAGTVRTAVDTVYVTAGSAGYQLYVGMSGSSNALIRDGTDGAGAGETIPASVVTDMRAPAVLSNNTWGFATLAPGSGDGAADVVANGFDGEYGVGDESVASNKFIAVPVKGEDVLVARRSGAAEAVATKIYYGARATSAQASGLYKGTVVYTAIGDSSAVGLASVSPSRTKLVQGGENLTVATPSTLALGSISQTEVTVGGESCLGATAVKSDGGAGEQTNATCVAPALATGWHEVVVKFITTSGAVEEYVVEAGIEYYAEPEDLEVATLYELVDGKNLQEMTSGLCAAAKQDTAETANFARMKDARDGQSYRVAKLADGNCWMVENLRLGSTIVSGGSITIDASGSQYAGASFTINASDVITTSGANWGDMNALHIYARQASEVDGNGNPYGNLYNFYTMTAKSGTGGSEDALTSGDAEYSICPKGWRLPSMTGNPSWTYLFQVPTSEGGLGLTTLRGTDKAIFGVSAAIAKAPYFFALGGDYFHNDSGEWRLWNVNGYTTAMTQTAVNMNTESAFIYGSGGNFEVQSGVLKHQGRAARCVFGG